MFSLLLFTNFSNPSLAFIQSESINKDEIKLRIVTNIDQELLENIVYGFITSSYANSIGINSIDDLSIISAQTFQAFLTGSSDPELSADIIWGNSIELFENLLNQTNVKGIDKDIINDQNANYPRSVSNTKMYQEQETSFDWIFSHITSLGVISDAKVKDYSNLTFESWKDLAEPDLFNANSALIALPLIEDNPEFYTNLFQQFEWNTAWEVLYSLVGNSRFNEMIDMIHFENNTALVGIMDIAHSIPVLLHQPDYSFSIPEEAYISGLPITIGQYGLNSEASNAFIQYLFGYEGQIVSTQKEPYHIPANLKIISNSTSAVFNMMYQLVTRLNETSTVPTDVEYNGTDLLVHCLSDFLVYDIEDNLKLAWNELVSALNNDSITKAEFYELRGRYGKPMFNQSDYTSCYEFIELDASEISDAKINQIDEFLEYLSTYILENQPSSETSSSNTLLNESSPTSNLNEGQSTNSLGGLQHPNIMIFFITIFYYSRKRNVIRKAIRNSN